MPDLEKPVAEVPGVVVGGPLDATAPEGQPPEGHVVNAPASAPFYQGLSGDIKSAEDLKAYTKVLEDKLIESAAKSSVVAPSLNPMPPTTNVAPGLPSNKQRFSELIFSNPEEAFEIAVSEANSRSNAARDTERRHEAFWNDFYTKNADLGKMKSIVNSIVSQRGQEISKLKTEAECEKFISEESRKVIDLVKKESGFVETRVESGNAVILGGSGETVPRAPVAPAAPLNFAEQIRRLKPAGKARA